MHMLYAMVVAALVVIRSSNRQHTIEPKHNASACKYTYTKLDSLDSYCQFVHACVLVSDAKPYKNMTAAVTQLQQQQTAHRRLQ
jgi:hypothetical protein